MITTPRELKAARCEMGLSIYEFADLLRLGPTTERGGKSVREMESGTRRITGPVSQLTSALLSGWRPESEEQ